MKDKHIVSVSSGAPSALLAIKVLEKYGAENVIGLFADTGVEHHDNYRFLYDLQNYGVEILFVTAGTTPEEMQRKQVTIFTQRLAPCTNNLKLKPIRKFVEWLQSRDYQVHMHIGYTVEDRDDKRGGRKEGRLGLTRKNWLSNSVIPHFQLVDEGYTRHKVQEELESRGLKIPSSYANGLPNANCVQQGGCVKGGKSYMEKILRHYPEYYSKREKLECEIRFTQYMKQRKSGVRPADVKMYAYLRDATRSSGHITLKTFREQYEESQLQNREKYFTLENDMEGLCGVECGVSDPGVWNEQGSENNLIEVAS